MQWDLAITMVGAVVLVLGLLSGLIRPKWLSEPMLALAAGVVLGPAVLGWLDPWQWGEAGDARWPRVLVEHAALLTMAIGVMGVALRLPARFLREHWRPLTLLLGPVMVAMWLVGGALVWALLGTGMLTALAIGAVITPTDPVLATSIVTGDFARRRLPATLRHLISAESGVNDGLAVLVVMLPVLLLTNTTAASLLEWSLHVLLWQVVGAVALGWWLGLAAGWLLRAAERHQAIEQTPLLAYSLALSLVALGLGELAGMTGILVVFMAGRGFATEVSLADRQREQQTQEAVNRFFLLPIFVLLGLVLPWDAWGAMGWRGVALVAAVLLVRRLPAVWLAMRLARRVGADAEPQAGLRGQPGVWFVGWFGPIGVAALYYAMHVETLTPLENVWPVASLVVVGSTVVHGITAAPFTRLYDRATGLGDSTNAS
ncbi:MAG: cation:proton antiporter [Phycisphaeraceae bacterium]